MGGITTPPELDEEDERPEEELLELEEEDELLDEAPTGNHLRNWVAVVSAQASLQVPSPPTGMLEEINATSAA